MAISNKMGPMVLTTGNKSEMSVGYATLYGDMCGGYSVLKVVYKTAVFELCHWRNRHRPDDFTSGAGTGLLQSQRESLAKRRQAVIKVGIGAPAKMARAVQNLFHAHLEDHVRVRADPRSVRCHVP